MTSIKIKFRPSALKDREGTIYYQVIQNRRVRRFNTGYHIYKDEWDERIGIVLCSNSNSPRYEYLCSIKRDIQYEIKRFENLVEEMENKDYSINELMSLCRDEPLSKNGVFEYLGKQIERLRSLGRIRSCEAMQSTLHSFRKFRGEIDISFTKLDKDVIEQYEAYLRNRGLSRNTTSFYMRNFRSAYRTAVEEGITNDVHPFCKVYTGVDKTTKRAITIDDIRRIKYLNTSNRPALDFAKDILLFSFYTRGMSFVDMAYLRKKDIANGYITYYRKKTGQQLSVELVPDILDIISKYHNETQYLLPLILVENGTERKQYRNQMMKINRNLKKIGKMINLSVPLSTYVARHAWATIARDKGISLSVISKGLGHDSEITTQIYLDSLQNSKIDKANRLILSDL
ncbi:site-specific integrase [Barnesiella sp. An22]|uniref:site-specific integrase n=1 Tax=Barnesiella sp. An22 TaxID=1965590 RepID=UPI000B398D48|nr:site-specific integrase [Barnesiella sp. An22]OUO99713.1 hypothetical protein B5F38_02515 [Barnesiella sp. An22]HJB72031.1 site-specific integrase [Candidatus Barnesiella merdigallinarum]